MNYNAMSDTELIRYLDLHSQDPLIRRLIGVQYRTQDKIISELESAGMDPRTWTFEHDHYADNSPAEYIERLRQDIEYYREEAAEWESRYDDMKQERDQLRVRSVMELMSEVHSQRLIAEESVRAADREIKHFREENQALKQKLEMWGQLNHVNQGV